MRRAIALALCAIVLSGDASARFDSRFLQPCDNRPPDTARQAVTVPTSIFLVPSAQMFAKCRKQPNGLVIYGCTFQAMQGHPAVVLINAEQSPAERACTLVYEESHLPPNNWADPQMEAATPDLVPRPNPSTASTGLH